jgi:hypothetical protein
MYYALIGYDGERWSAHGCDDFEWRDEEPGKDGPALDRLKQRTFHKIQELNDGHTIIVKWLYTNIAYRHYKKLLNEHAKAAVRRHRQREEAPGRRRGYAGLSSETWRERGSVRFTGRSVWPTRICIRSQSWRTRSA